MCKALLAITDAITWRLEDQSNLDPERHSLLSSRFNYSDVPLLCSRSEFSKAPLFGLMTIEETLRVKPVGWTFEAPQELRQFLYPAGSPNYITLVYGSVFEPGIEVHMKEPNETFPFGATSGLAIDITIGKGLCGTYTSHGPTQHWELD